MTITRKYIRQCRTLFPVYGNSERTLLNRLKVQINEHLDLFPDLSYEELVKLEHLKKLSWNIMLMLLMITC